jgi:hypothetical protein
MSYAGLGQVTPTPVLTPSAIAPAMATDMAAVNRRRALTTALQVGGLVAAVGGGAALGRRLAPKHKIVGALAGGAVGGTAAFGAVVLYALATWQ